jgi:hypothetical protein
MRARELFAKMILAILALIIFGCGASVRDPKVYEAEIEFMEAAAGEQVARGMAVIEEYCVCDEVAGAKGFTSEECHNLAETILVVKYRMRYHTEFMRYLGGLSKRRPPKDPPEVPETSALCPGGEPLPEVPMREPEELDELPDDEADAGTD